MSQQTFKKNVSIFFPVFFLMVSSLYAADNSFRINTSIKPPFSTQSQDGFFDLIAKEIFTRMNIPLKIVRFPAERAMISVNKGLSDGELPRVAGLSRAYHNIIQVPESLIDYSFVAFSKPDKITDISFDSIKSQRVGIIIGWKIYENNTAGYPNLIKTALPSQLFAMLNIGHIEIALYEKYAGHNIIKTKGLDDIYECTPPLAMKPMYLYINRRHQDKLAKIVETLKSIKTDGTYQDISLKTLGQF